MRKFYRNRLKKLHFVQFLRFSTNIMTLLSIQIHSETNIFLSTKLIWVREKRGFISYSSAWGSDRRVCLKILPSRKNEMSNMAKSLISIFVTVFGFFLSSASFHEAKFFFLGHRSRKWTLHLRKKIICECSTGKTRHFLWFHSNVYSPYIFLFNSMI